MSMAKPFVLFVHSSFHEPAHFDPLRIFFHAAGYETACPRLASSRGLQAARLIDDVDMVRDGLRQLIEVEGLDVMIVAHGYGGVVMTEAADAELGKSHRSARGLAGGVVQLLYVCSYLLRPGQSIANCCGGELPSFLVENDQGMAEVQAPESVFFNDLCISEQKHWADRLLRSPSSLYFTPITQSAYLYHPTTCLFATEDVAIPVEMQQKLVADATVANPGLTVRTIEYSSGHAPFLSMPERILELVQNMTATEGGRVNGN